MSKILSDIVISQITKDIYDKEYEYLEELFETLLKYNDDTKQELVDFLDEEHEEAFRTEQEQGP